MRASTCSFATLVLLLASATPCSGQAGWTDLGKGLAGANGVPQLTQAWGTLSPVGNFGWELNHCAFDSTALLVAGASAIDAPFKGGVMVPFPDFIYFPGQWTGPGGVFGFGAVWPVGIPAGAPMDFQYWIADPAAVHGWSASNALTTTTA
ncbi:MAG TPA: hypothetical protein VFY71_07255 [Planctomycetota bacterium]|nr:hypothetical protein [Planctomycetota bacterium]